MSYGNVEQFTNLEFEYDDQVLYNRETFVTLQDVVSTRRCSEKLIVHLEE
jgi:hypothetical protein